MRQGPTRVFDSIPTATGGLARLAVERLQAEGRAVAPILDRAGISQADVADPRARIATAAQVRLLETAAEVLDDDLFGFRLARDYDLRRIGLFYYIVASARTLPEAFQDAQRYCRIVNEGVHAVYLPEAQPVISLEYDGIAGSADRQHVDFWLTTLVRLCRQITGSRVAPVAVRMRPPRAEVPEDMRAFFGVAPEFGAPADQIVLPAATTTMALVGADPYLNDLLRGFADRALAERRERVTGVRGRIERLLPCLLPRGRATAAEIARELGVSRRTLSRQLQAEGAGLPEIIEDTRTALAISYLEDDTIPISQIAWLLGYKEVSSFTNAFRTWTGRTPSDVRAEAERKRAGA